MHSFCVAQASPRSRRGGPPAAWQGPDLKISKTEFRNTSQWVLFQWFGKLQNECCTTTLTDQQPTGRYPIAPMVASVFVPLFSDWQCEVVALELQRTFWEKATILHAEFHRPHDLPTPDRYARHYFDMVGLLAHADAQQFLADKAQCERVVGWKRRVFARGWARYDLARHGMFRLVPPAARQAELARDYATMRPMFMTEPPSFDVLLRELQNAENAINA